MKKAGAAIGAGATSSLSSSSSLEVSLYSLSLLSHFFKVLVGYNCKMGKQIHGQVVSGICILRGQRSRLAKMVCVGVANVYMSSTMKFVISLCSSGVTDRKRGGEGQWI